MASQQLEKMTSETIAYIEEGGLNIQAIKRLRDLATICVTQEKDRKYALFITENGKKYAEDLVRNKVRGSVLEFNDYCVKNELNFEEVNLYYDFLKIESPYLLESFIIHMEHKRPFEKQFYLPRKKTLKVVVDDLQKLEDTDMKFYGLSMPSRVGKSTTCIFFLAWIMYKRPNSHSAMGGHSGVLAEGFYKELLNLITTEEYTYAELFQFAHKGHVCLRDKSADKLTINLDAPDRFSTFTARGIDGTWTGAVDISGGKINMDNETGVREVTNIGYLYIDDLVRDREHSLSPTRMENTWQEMLNKCFDRMNDGAKILMVGTLWNVLDPLERMRGLYEGNPLYQFRRIPALDENDESNFDYDVNGFSTQYYHEMRDRLDNAEWMAKYMQRPFVREGLLFPQEELRYFNGILPEGDHKIVAVCDVAFGGGDSLSMPIGCLYENGDCYIFDWVFSSAPKEITVPTVVGKVILNEIRELRFEANRGGDLYADLVSKELSKEGWKCSCTSKQAPNNMEKVSKIIAYSGDIKKHFVFLQSRKPSEEERQADIASGTTRYTRSAEYQKAMDEMQTFVTIGKNVHDDSVDSLTQLEMFIEAPYARKKAVIMSNPFMR